MPRVTFRDADGAERATEIADGQTVFDAGARLGVGIDTSCVGKGTCGLCRVKVLDGADALPPYTDEELKHLGNVYHITRVRLSCRLTVRGGDVVVALAGRRQKRGRT